MADLMVPTAALKWITGDDTGMSSCAIWAHMLGFDAAQVTRWGASYPLDSGDFGRCYRLLDLVPEWRGRMGEMARYGAAWAALAEAWPDLERLYVEEVGTSGRHHRSRPSRLYDRIKRAIAMERAS